MAFSPMGLTISADQPQPILTGGTAVQSAQPRDIGILALVVGLFVILTIVTLMVGR